MSPFEPAYRAPAGSPPEERLARLATRQRGLVTHRQLRTIGFSASAVGRRIAAGRLHRVHPGVYAVGHASLPLDARRLAAVMACGPTAALSHQSTLRLVDLVDGRDGPPFHVTTSSRRGRDLKGIHHHRAALPLEDRTRIRGVPSTTTVRALLDAAPTLGDGLQRAVDRAAQRGLADDLAALVRRSPGHHGAKALRAALRATFADAHRTKREFELRLRRLLADTPLPQPLSNVPIGAYEVDLLWPDHAFVVEADGFGTHGRSERERFEDDRRRTADLTAQGYAVLRFTWRQLTDDPAWVLGHVVRALRR